MREIVSDLSQLHLRRLPYDCQLRLLLCTSDNYTDVLLSPARFGGYH